jgi:purine-binding chemotaxis protein CheW
MSDKQYLIFSLHGSQYGVSTDLVREISWLPELYSLATSPPDILGMFNWRSQMVPVMHLDLRFGQRFLGCNITDRIIVVEWQNTYLAIVAHEVYDVETLDPQSFNLSQNRDTQANNAFVTGIAQLNEQPVICLDLERLIRDPDAVSALADQDEQDLAGTARDFYARCYPQVNHADRATFAARAADVTQVKTEEGVLVVQVGKDYLGFPLELIVDVDAIDRFPVSPVPVAPNYLLGQINWRGKILPVLELGSVLKMPTLPRPEFVVAEINGVRLGLMVDRIFDVTYLADAQIDTLPIAVSGQARTYLRGVTDYADSMMYLVKLQELVEQEFLPASV